MYLFSSLNYSPGGNNPSHNWAMAAKSSIHITIWYCMSWRKCIKKGATFLRYRYRATGGETTFLGITGDFFNSAEGVLSALTGWYMYKRRISNIFAKEKENWFWSQNHHPTWVEQNISVVILPDLDDPLLGEPAHNFNSTRLSRDFLQEFADQKGFNTV